MSKRVVALIESPPKFEAKGDHFYVDIGVAGVPIIALSPAVMLAAITAAGREYKRWESNPCQILRKP